MAIDRVIPGDFGDCEITAVGFSYPDVVVKIYDPNRSDFYSVTFSGVEYFFFETDHVQNVISFIYVFDNIKDGMRNDDFVNWVQKRGLLNSIEGLAGNHRVCFISPIAGANVLIVYQDASMN